MTKLAIIGGSGLYSLPGLEDIQEREITTPFGEPSAPIIIGRVAECKKDDQKPLLWDITIKPACDIERLEDVAVIIMNP